MQRKPGRRDFLKSATALALSAPYITRIQRPRPKAAKFDPDFGTAGQAAEAIRAGVISAREITEHCYHRIKQYNPKLNAFVTLVEEDALKRAKQADEALAGSKPWGPLHGVPILIKDGFSTEGVRTTAGSKLLETYVPPADAITVARLKKAGAIMLGKTNVPEFLADWQSYNQIAGTANNPWDLNRTPGGSTGGGAAALAAGLGFLELGSDIGGSIRVPSHFCGIYGHKPTLDVVPLQGHIPPPPGVLAPAELPVAGPLARSARDLLLELEIIGGPTVPESVAYRWSVPPPRKTSLKDFRIGYVVDDPFCRLDAPVAEVISQTIEALRKQGATLTEGWPAGIKPEESFDTYFRLLAAVFASTLTDEQFKQIQESIPKMSGGEKLWSEGMVTPHREWLLYSGRRLKARELWQQYFKTHDVFLMPTDFVAAFPHDHTPNAFERVLNTSQGQRKYMDQLGWISFATLTGCPATIAPVGHTKGGLPVGIQIMGPFMEDATSIKLAELMVQTTGGFAAPPGYL
jgi:amidase